MKVKEMIELLSELDKESDVVFLMDVGCCGDILDLDLNDISTFNDEEDNLTFFKFDPIAGHRSCEQVIKTEQNDKKYWKNISKGQLQ